MNEYPYFNPYAPYMPMQNSAYPPANQIQGVRFVSNRQEAESCAVPRGTKALLMDSNKDIFYLKETDMNGISTISEYSFKKVEPQNNPMTELLDFIKSSNITPQQAQEKVQSLISSGQMSQQQFETLKQQAMNIAKFFN